MIYPAPLLPGDRIAALIPPWGGELAIELLDRLDWTALQGARPKWLLGYSDTSTLMLALTLRLGWATAHGPCLMDLAPGQNDPLTRHAMAALATPAGGRLAQSQSSHRQLQWTDFADVPDVTYQLTERTRWQALQGQTEVNCSGRLLGRSAAPDTTAADELRYADALRSSLAGINCPVLWDVDIGHRPPQMVLFNGALANVHWSAAEGGRIEQQLV